jgi:DNA-binding MarR family transcriptional regulator
MNTPNNQDKEDKLLQLEEIFQEVGLYMTKKVLQDCEVKLTHPQYFTMKRLESGPATVSEVAEYLGVSLSAITSMSDRLVKTGYIARLRSDTDRRLVWLELTEEGRRIFVEAGNKKMKMMYELLSNLSDDDLSFLHRVYLQLLEKIKNSNSEA